MTFRRGGAARGDRMCYHCNDVLLLSVAPIRSDPALLPGLLPVPGWDVHPHHVHHVAHTGRLQPHLAGPPGYSR